MMRSHCMLLLLLQVFSLGHVQADQETPGPATASDLSFEEFEGSFQLDNDTLNRALYVRGYPKRPEKKIPICKAMRETCKATGSYFKSACKIYPNPLDSKECPLSCMWCMDKYGLENTHTCKDVRGEIADDNQSGCLVSLQFSACKRKEIAEECPGSCLWCAQRHNKVNLVEFFNEKCNDAWKSCERTRAAEESLCLYNYECPQLCGLCNNKYPYQYTSGRARCLSEYKKCTGDQSQMNDGKAFSTDFLNDRCPDRAAACKKWKACDGGNEAGSCCTKEEPCQWGRGDCDSDADCTGNLVCGKDNCQEWRTGAVHTSDCCMNPDCKGERGQGGCCTKEKPCKIAGGDCDNDSECAGNLVCGRDNCQFYHGFVALKTSDCCMKSPSATDKCDGSKVPGQCCATDAPCDYGEGQCESNDQCAGNLVCGNPSSCLDFNSKASNSSRCCVQPGCKGRKGEDNCCTKDKPCNEGMGDCDTDDECKGFLECGSNNCKWPGAKPTSDCCQKPDHIVVKSGTKTTTYKCSNSKTLQSDSDKKGLKACRAMGMKLMPKRSRDRKVREMLWKQCGRQSTSYTKVRVCYKVEHIIDISKPTTTTTTEAPQCKN